MTIKQFKVGFDNFAYIIFCNSTKKAAIVDPGFDFNKIIDYILSKNLILELIIATHYHYDHVKGIKKIKNKFQSSKIVASELDGKQIPINIDKYVKDNEKIKLGEITLTFLTTPGHTPGGISIIVNNESILTGDTLFIGDCGRTDLPGGNIKIMFNTLKEKIAILPDNLIVYPGHDYGNKPFDTLGNQKRRNKTLIANSIEEFSKIP
jgi:glyoxylase-like metal-dependent hydrolase (beta-lactamase superfamily II)